MIIQGLSGADYGGHLFGVDCYRFIDLSKDSEIHVGPQYLETKEV